MNKRSEPNPLGRMLGMKPSPRRKETWLDRWHDHYWSADNWLLYALALGTVIILIGFAC